MLFSINSDLITMSILFSPDVYPRKIIYIAKIEENQCSRMIKPVGCDLFMTYDMQLEFYDLEWKKTCIRPGVWSFAKSIAFITNYTESSHVGHLRFTDNTYVTNVKPNEYNYIKPLYSGTLIIFSMSQAPSGLTFDLSRITHLTLRNVKIQKLNLINCVSLRSVVCSECGILSIDLGSCMFLKHLQCDGNELRDLDMRSCLNIETVDCSNNALTRIYINGLCDISYMNCSGNKLINQSFGCTKYDTLNLSYNPLGPNVKFGSRWIVNNLIVRKAGIVKIKLPRRLKTLDVSFNNIRNIHHDKELKALNCSYNFIKSLQLTCNLIDVNCCFNDISSINLIECNNLKRLVCNNNKITSLRGLWGLDQLEFLDCRYNSLVMVSIPGSVREAKCNLAGASCLVKFSYLCKTIRIAKHEIYYVKFNKCNVRGDKGRQICSICLARGRSFVVTHCNHVFHKKCINKCIMYNGHRCPICRQDMFHTKIVN